MNELGERLKEARNKKGITLKQLSHKIGFSDAYISQIENGKRNKPSREFFNKASTVLGTSSRYLKTGLKSREDLTDEDYEDILKNEFARRKQRELDDKKDLEDTLKIVLNKDLSSSERVFLKQSLILAREAEKDDLRMLTGILIQYNRYKNIYQVTRDMDGLLEEIDFIKEEIEKLFRKRFGLTEYDEGD